MTGLSSNAITYTIGQHTIVEDIFDDGLHFFLPFTHLPPSALNNYFCWTLDAALIVSIHYHNKGKLDPRATTLANQYLGVSDRAPDGRSPNRTTATTIIDQEDVNQ